MALNKEILIANESLKTLSDDQIATIETLSKTDENTVIGTKIGELHGMYDQDVIAVTGAEKKQGEKTYDFVKRVLTDFKTKAEAAKTHETEIATLKGKVAEYEEKINSGKGNEVIAQQLKDAQKQLGLVQSQYETDKANWTTKESQHQTEMNNYKLDVEFATATSGLKFKPVYPADIQKTLLDSAKSSILSSYKVDWIDNGKAGKALVFRDEKGDIVRNPENKLEPFTPGELITKQLKEVLDFGKQQKGAGTDPRTGGTDYVGDLPDLGGATNQIQADEIIMQFLMKKGLTRGSAEFADEQTKVRKALEVAKLPVR